MARIAVVNPPKRHKRRKIRARRVRRVKRRFSAKARAAALRNLKHARAKLHRPKARLGRRTRRKIRRAVRKHRRNRARFVNPFAGTLAVMGNPGRKSRSGHKRRKHTMARRKHRRHSRRSLSNPFSVNSLLATPKELVSTQFITEAAGVAVGFVLPNMAMNYLPVTWRSTTMTYYASKVATVAVLSAAASMVSKRIGKFVLLGGGVSLMLDLYTEFVGGKAPTSPAPAAPAGTQAFYGNLGAYYGGMMNDWEVD